MSGKPDIQRLVGDLVQFGTIDSVDLGAATVRVRLGDALTGNVPWLAARAGAVRIWCPPIAGEQCLFLASEGDAEAGVALPGLYCDAHPAPSSSATMTLIQFADDAQIGYDHGSHALTATLPGGGTAALTVPGGLTITGPVTIDGAVTMKQGATLSGTLTASDDVVASGKSLKGHKHLGVQPGSGVSGTPQ